MIARRGLPLARGRPARPCDPTTAGDLWPS